jgi:hypothetical protein
MGDERAVVGDEGHADLDQVCEFSSAPRVIRTPDLLIRSRRHASPFVFIRASSLSFRGACSAIDLIERAYAQTRWLPTGYQRSIPRTGRIAGERCRTTETRAEAHAWAPVAGKLQAAAQLLDSLDGPGTSENGPSVNFRESPVHRSYRLNGPDVTRGGPSRPSPSLRTSWAQLPVELSSPAG